VADWESHLSELHEQEIPFDPSADPCDFLSLIRAKSDNLPYSARDPLDAFFTLDEVSNQIHRTSYGKAPGHDGITYEVLKKFPSLWQPLCTLFNQIRVLEITPRSWDVAEGVIIPKPDRDPTRCNSWRTIFLSPCIYKIFAGIMAKRAADFMITNKLLAPNQKGFIAVDGCGEHSFVSRAILTEAQAKRSDLYQTYYDVKNGFGAAAQSVIFHMLKAHGFTDKYIKLVGCSLLASTVRLKINDKSSTRSIRLASGLKTGCPWSPILYNIQVNPLAWKLYSMRNVGVQLGSVRVNSLQFADDLKTISTTKEGCLIMHEHVTKFNDWIGAELRVSKCAVLAYKKSTRSMDESFRLEIKGERVPMLHLHEGYQYLGVKDDLKGDARINASRSRLKDVTKEVIQIFQTDVPSWQKIHMVNTFCSSKLMFGYKNGQVSQVDLDKFDEKVRQLIKNDLQLPVSTTNDFIYGSKKNGGLGMFRQRHIMKLTQLSHALNMLNAEDETIRSIAMYGLRTSIGARYIGLEGDPPPQLVCDFLSGNDADLLGVHGLVRRTGYGQVSTLWALVQRSIVSNKDWMKLTYHDATRCFQINGVHGNKVLSHLKSKLQATVDASWGAKKDQGKMVGYSSPAHWLNGRDIYPDEFIFAAKARVNKVPVRSVLVRERQATNGKCRHCGETETLAHVLNHCPHNMAYIRERHERVTRSSPHSCSPGYRCSHRAWPTEPWCTLDWTSVHAGHTDGGQRQQTGCHLGLGRCGRRSS
jgi:hypothetical protein